MLRQVAALAGFHRQRRVVAVTTAAAATTATAGGLVYYYNYNKAANNSSSSSIDRTLGLRRQGEFWIRVAPIVFDYYWNFASSSPYVRYQNYTEALYTEPSSSSSSSLISNKTKAQGAAEDDEDGKFAAMVSITAAQQKKQRRAALQKELHERHAPQVLQIILDLKGLYVKLGQVLSVTALPIPETYRERFRTLQSDVPGYEEFERTVKPTLERELGTNDLSSIFSYIDPIPCGAASIGQAHRATLAQDGAEVVIKIQYPEAAWQVPADIECVGHLLKLWVYTGLVDESAANLSFNDFSNQFLAELDYKAEQNNLREVYQSSLAPDSPYKKRGIVVPKVVPELCTQKVITMSYLRGPKLEQEARRQLELLGIDTKRSMMTMVRDAAAMGGASKGGDDNENNDDDTVASASASSLATSWKVQMSKAVVQVVGVNGMLWAFRLARRILQWSKIAVAASISVAAPILPRDWETWSKSHQMSMQQAQRLALTQSWIDALFDVHGYQIFQQGLFNADCHPGNILVIEEDDDRRPPTRLGLIDYGQCKRLNPSEQVRVARLILSVANKESDEQIANAFRGLGVGTRNDSAEFLAQMARLMFGPIQVEYLDHTFHKRLHNMDRITYFPKDLAMVYRTSLLLRGLAVSLQVNASVSEQWQSHAAACIDQHGGMLEIEEVTTVPQVQQASPTQGFPSADTTITML